MTSNPTPSQSIPHLTPARLVGLQFGRDIFHGIKVALVGYCPRPDRLDRYQPQNTADQYFIHVPAASVQIGAFEGRRFLSVTHVYGGPVSAALVEELAYYGVQYVLAYGLAGGLGTKNLKMGDFFLVERALALDGTTPHYTPDAVISSDAALNAQIAVLARQKGIPLPVPVQSMTGDAIYREYDAELRAAREKGCDIVNCDSSHLFAVSRSVGIQSTEWGVISDVVKETGDSWDSALSLMLASDQAAGFNPLALTGKIVEFYVETLMPDLLSHP